MSSSLDAARYLIHLASPSEDEDTDCLCHLRLQKLLYYVQAWHLAVRDKPLFGERIEAWTNGPVVKDVYPAFANYGYHSIPPTEGMEPTSLTEQDKAFVRSVWDAYKQFSAGALRDKTHRESPWRDARGNLGPDERSSAEITHQAMRAYFLPRLDKWLSENDSRVNKGLWERARAAIASGQVQTAQGVYRALHHHRTGTDPG